MDVLTRWRDFVARRIERQPSWVLLIETFVGLGWLRAAVAKVASPDWWRGDVIREFVVAQDGRGLPWWEPFLDGVVLEVPALVAIAVVAGQLLAGTSLLTARFLGTGLTVGMTMNLAFVLTGAVDPSVFYLILQAVIALWLYEQHARRAVGIRSLTSFLAAAVALALASGPFIRSLDPMKVTDDPATVLTTYAVTIAVATYAARRRLVQGQTGLLGTELGQERQRRTTVVAGQVAPPPRRAARTTTKPGNAGEGTGGH